MKIAKATLHGLFRIHRDKEVEFANWLENYDAAVSRFPGSVSTEYTPLNSGSNEWSMRLEFATEDQLHAWLDSKERATLLIEGEPILNGGTVMEIARQGDPEQGITEVILTKLKPGCEEAYRAWTAKINRAQSKYKGYAGATLQAPLVGQDHWTTLLRFDTPANLEAWLKAPERAELLREQEPFVENEHHSRIGSSFPGWIPAPPPQTSDPPNWKTTALVILGLFPIVMLELKFLNPHIAKILPTSPGTLLANAISASLVSYLTMPLFIRAFKWWLFLKKDAPSWITPAGVFVVLALYALEVLLLWNLF
ncbi:MAG TPA: hypothetical protein VIT00_12590 [Terrimicrobiaceae bacterium]